MRARKGSLLHDRDGEQRTDNRSPVLTLCSWCCGSYTVIVVAKRYSFSVVVMLAPVPAPLRCRTQGTVQTVALQLGHVIAKKFLLIILWVIFLESILVVLTINNLLWTYHLAELFRMLLLKCITESNPSTWCYRSPFELQVSHVGIWVWGNSGEKENCQRILDKEQQPKLYGVVWQVQELYKS